MFDARNGDQPLFYQVYLAKDRQKSREVLQKVDKLGAKAIVFTVDVMCQSKRTLDVRTKVTSNPSPKTTQSAPPAAGMAGVSAALAGYQDTSMTWKDIDFIRVR